MSTNLHLSASRNITVNSKGKAKGKTDVQYINYNLWQTPTTVTTKIMLSGNIKQGYKDYVMSLSQDRTELIYHEDDIFRDGKPIGSEVINESKTECVKFDEWLVEAEEDGYTIEFSAW